MKLQQPARRQGAKSNPHGGEDNISVTDFLYNRKILRLGGVFFIIPLMVYSHLREKTVTKGG